MFSAEPCRWVAYASDLRWRIVWCHIGMEQSFHDIARSLNMSVGTAFNVFEIFKDTGDVEPKHREYPGFAVTQRVESTILAIIVWESYFVSEWDYTKDLWVHKWEDISIYSVHCLMHRHGLTRNKIQRIALPRSSTYRGAYMADISMYKPDMLVFADETDKDCWDCLRRFGYALKATHLSIPKYSDVA